MNYQGWYGLLLAVVDNTLASIEYPSRVLGLSYSRDEHIEWLTDVKKWATETANHGNIFACISELGDIDIKPMQDFIINKVDEKIQELSPVAQAVA